jgi:hypothetical protein
MLLEHEMAKEVYPTESHSATPGGHVIPLPHPPYSTEAEQAVLGGLLLDNSAWRTVAEILTAADFYRPDHRLIFDAIAKLASKGFPFDIVTLAEELTCQGKLEEVGGFARLGILARDTPSAANVNVYARIVLERSIDRQRQAAAKQHNWAAIERLTQRLTTLQAAPDHRYTPITDAELWAKTFPPVRWAVPELIPEGVTILAGSPKIGKSWLALGIAAAVASGGIALGTTPVEQGEVLYLALEDSQRRLQQRLQCVMPLPCDRPTGHLHFVTEWPRLHAGGAERLETWLTAHPHARLVIIDTLEKVRPRTASLDRNLYTADYIVGDLLTPLSKQHSVSILLIHHTRKAIADDPLDLVSGTLGLTGGVDGVMVLRRQRGQADAFLYVTGRDIEEEKDYALSWDARTTTWAIKGDARDYTGSEERLEVIELLREHGALSVMEIAQFLNPGVEITRDCREFNRARQLVYKAKNAGKIEQMRFDKRYHLYLSKEE